MLSGIDTVLNAIYSVKIENTYIVVAEEGRLDGLAAIGTVPNAVAKLKKLYGDCCCGKCDR